MKRNRFLLSFLLGAAGLMLLLLARSPAQAQQSLTLEQQSSDNPLTETETMPYQRWQWFNGQRADPFDVTPPDAMYRARRQLKIALEKELLTQAAPVRGNIWEQLGPTQMNWPASGPFSGRVRTIAVQSPSTIYIGGASGGVWKTVNGGGSWTPITDNQPSLSMGSIAIDPLNSSIIYAGTGEYNGNGYAPYGAGLLKSTNGGNNWVHIPGPWDTLQGGGTINKVVVIPGPNSSDPNDDIVFVAGNFGLFRSTQGGSDFTDNSIPVLGGVLNGVPDVVIDPTNTSILYAVIGSDGVYRSINSGVNWVRIWTPSTGCQIGRGALALAPTNTNILYAAFEANPDTCGVGSGAIFRTTNAQAPSPTFTQLITPTYPDGNVWEGQSWCREQCYYDLSLIVQPIDPDGQGPLNPQNIVYTGGVGLFRTTDGGTHWTLLGEPPTGIHVDVHALAFDSNGALYVGTDGGVNMHPNPETCETLDSGWINLNTNLAITQFYAGVSLHPNSSELALGGNQDNGLVKYTGGTHWDVLEMGDGGYTAIDFNYPDTIWYAMVNSNIRKTTNGNDFSIVNNNLPRRGHNGYFSRFAMCPDDSQVLIIDDDWGVWRSNNGANNWFDNSPGFAVTRAMAFAPDGDCNTYFVGSQNGRIHRTTTGGGTNQIDWTDITGNLPNREPTDIMVHPTDFNIVYITLAGYCGNNDSCPNNQGHVWRTENALASTVTWTDLTGGKGLPNVPVRAIVLDPSDPQTLYIGTDLSVFRSFNAGMTWELLNNGLPNVAISDLVINNETNVLVASTYGRSMFRLKGAIYVDVRATSYENGTAQFPYNTLSEGVSAVPSKGEVWIRAGTYTGPGNVPITISKEMALISYEGTAIIGNN